MPDDELLSLKADVNEAVQAMLALDKAAETLNSELKNLDRTFVKTSKSGDLLSGVYKGLTASGEKATLTIGKKLKQAVNEAGEALFDELGKPILEEVGFEVKTINIEKAKKSTQDLLEESRALLAALLRVSQIKFANLDKAKKDRADIPELQTTIEKSLAAPTADQIRNAVQQGKRPPTGIKATLESQFGLTAPILGGASQKSLDQLEKSFDNLIKMIVKAQLSTEELSKITDAYTRATTPKLDRESDAILKQIRLVDQLARSIGGLNRPTSPSRARQQTAEDILSKQIAPILTDPKLARQVQASQSFFTIPRPQVFANLGSNEEVAQVKKISDQIRELIVNNAEITKKSVKTVLQAISTGTTDNLKGPLRELANLIGQLDQAYVHLGASALDAQIKQQRAIKNDIANVSQSRNAINQEAEQIAQRNTFANQTVRRATARQDIPAIAFTDPQALSRLQIYNSNLLSIQNTSRRVSLSIKEINEVFDAVKTNDVTNLINREQQELFSTIVTLNSAYDKLIGKVNDLKSAEDAATAAIARQNAEAAKSLNAQRTSALTRQTFPTIESVGTSVPDFDKKAQLTLKYQTALDHLDRTILKFGADESAIAQARIALKLPDLQVDEQTQQLRNALRAVETAYEDIGIAAQRAATIEQAAVQKQTAAADKLAEKNRKTADAIVAATTKQAQVAVARSVARTAVTPTTFPIGLPPEEATQRFAQIQFSINSIVNSIDGSKITLDGFNRALVAAGDPTKIDGLTRAELALAQQIIRNTQLIDKFHADAAKANDITLTPKFKISFAETAITSAFKIPKLTDVEDKLAQALESAQRRAIDRFSKGGTTSAELTTLISEATSGLGSRLTTVEPKLAPLYADLVKLADLVTKVGGSFNRTGEAALKALRSDIATSAVRATTEASDLISRTPIKVRVAPDIEGIKRTLDSLKGSTFVMNTSGLDDLTAKLHAAAAQSNNLGHNFDEEKRIIIQAINDEIEALKRRDQADEDTANRSAARSAKRRADNRANAAARLKENTEASEKLFPTVFAGFTQPRVGGIDTGLKDARPIPSGASVADIASLKAGFQAVTNQVIRAGISQKDFLATLQLVRQQLKSGDTTFFAPLPPQLEKLRQSIIALDADLDRVRSGGSNAGRSILISWQGVFRLFQAQVLHTALAQLIGDFRQAVFEAGDFQREIGLVQTITQDLPDTFSQWSDTIRSVAVNLGKTPTEVATAAYDALSNQVTNTRESTEDFLNTAGQFARVTGSSLPDSVNLLSSAINSFGDDAGSNEEIAAKFFTTIDKGRVRANELANSFGRTSALGKALGVSFEDIDAGLIVLTQQGIRASEAQTQLNAIFSKLIKPTEATKDLFDELGITSGEQLVRINGFGGALQIIAKAAQEGKGDFAEFFNELRASKGAFTLARDGAQQFEKALKDVTNPSALENFNRAKKIIGEPAGVEFQRQIQELKTVITEDLGGKLAQVFVDLTKKFGSLADGMKAGLEAVDFAARVVNGTLIAIKSNPVFAGLTAGAFGYRAALKIVVNETLTWGGILDSINLKIAATKAFFATSAGLAVGISGGIFAAVAGFVALREAAKKLEEIRLQNFIDGQKEVKDAAEEMSRGFNASIDSMVDSLKNAVADQASFVSDWVSQIRKGKQQIVDQLEDLAKDAQNAMSISFDGVIDGAKNAISELTRSITEQERLQKQLAQDNVKEQEKVSSQQFERKLQLAPPQQQVPLLTQRFAQLRGQAETTLLDPNKIEEGNRQLEESNNILSRIADKIAELHKKKLDLGESNFARQLAFLQKPIKINITPNLQLQTALAELNKLQTIPGSDPAIARARQAALEKVNALSESRVRVSTSTLSPSTSQIQALFQIQKLEAQLGPLANNIAGAERLINTQLQSGVALRERAIKASQEQQQELLEQKQILEANVKEQQLNFKELSSIKFTTKTGELISDADVKKNEARFDELVQRILDGRERIDNILEKTKPGSVDFSKSFTDLTSFLSSVNVLRKANFDLVNEKKQIDSLNRLDGRFKEFGESVSGEIQRITDQVKDLNLEINKVLAGSGKTLEQFSSVVDDFNQLNFSDALSGRLLRLTPDVNFAPLENAFRQEAARLGDVFKGQIASKDFTSASTTLNQIIETVQKVNRIRGDKAFGELPLITGVDKSGQAIEEQILPVLERLKKEFDDISNKRIQIQFNTEAITSAEKFLRDGVLPSFTEVEKDENGFLHFFDAAGNQVAVLTQKFLDLRAKGFPIIDAISKLAPTNLKASSRATGTPFNIPLNPERAPTTTPEAKQLFPEVFRQQIPQPQPTPKPINTQSTQQILQFLNTLPDKVNSASQTLEQLNQPVNQIANQFDNVKQKVNQIDPALEGLSENAQGLNGAFNSFANGATTDIDAVAGSLGNLNRIIDQTKQNLASIPAAEEQAKGKSTGGVVYRATGGMVKVMTTPGEVFISPELTRKYYSQLQQANYFQSGGFIPKGTDTQPGYLPEGSFVLRRSASKYFFNNSKSFYINNENTLKRALHFETGGPVINKSWYDSKNNIDRQVCYYSGGGSVSTQSFNNSINNINRKISYYQEGGFTFTPMLSTLNTTYRNSDLTNNNNNSNTINFHNNINVTGGPTHQATANEIGKQLQRQVRLGILRFPK